MTGTAETWSGKDRGHENFPVGSILIRPDLRPHVHAFYRFARNADDIADNPQLAAEDKLARLDVMEEVLLGGREDGAPSAAALRASLAASGLDAGHPRDLLHAFRQDATKLRYADWDELLDYCRHSAMPVGRLVLDLHGEDQGTHGPSDALCAALQVLNHLQDCSRDLGELDRCYLPQAILRGHGSGVDEVRASALSPGLRHVVDTLLDEVDRLILAARALPAMVRDRRLRVETAMIVALARRLAARLRHGDPLAARVALSRGDFAWSLLSALRRLA